MDFLQVVKTRRTHKKFSGEAIPEHIVRELLSIAMLAPNHRRNEPWRFTVILQKQFSKLIEVIQESCQQVFIDKGEEFIKTKQQDLKQKLLKVGAIVYVTYIKDENMMVDQENYAATCCAIQNLLLAATEKKLGSYWGTGAPFAAQNTMLAMHVDIAKEKFVGSIWLGYPVENPEAPKYDIQSKIRIWQ